jgi:uncharacterized membrane protein YuzA (DUF378 family)
MKGGCTLAMITKVLVVVGGVNWGLVGLGMLLGSMSNWNVVNMIVGSVPVLEGVVYVLVGVSALMMIFGCKCGKCKDGVCESCVGGEKTEGSM